MEGAKGAGDRYRLHRGNLAMNFLFVMNFNQFVEMPRQFGKTVGACCRYLWVFNFGSSNSEIMFIHKDHTGSKNNLRTVKKLRDALPSYLQMQSMTTSDGKKLKVPNTVETMQHPLNRNKITTFASARSKDYANNLGRGCTMPLQYYDEFAFMPYNKIVYLAAVPAYSRAAENARNMNAPYGILMTTTPGDLLTDPGEYAYNVRNTATPWCEQYYDLTYDQLEDLRNSNTNSSFFLVSYTYQQLGAGEDYFKRMVVDMGRDWPSIRREVLLEWAKIANNCPFKQEDLDVIKQLCHDPIRTILFGRCQQYQFHVYEDIDLRYPPIVGVDVAGALYQDSSAITVVDSRTTRVSATLNCNYIPSDDLADVLYQLLTNYMPTAVCSIERNGGFGVSVIQRLCKTTAKKNLYYEIKDKVIEERFDGVHPIKKTAKVKVYGIDSTKEVRARLIEILYERVQYHKDKFVAPILHDEMEAMEVKKNGKVEHSDNSHDDQVFSYLMALRVWYDGINVMENFGLQKNTIKTDEEIDIEMLSVEEAQKGQTVDLHNVTADMENTQTIDDGLEEQLQYVKDASKYSLGRDFEKAMQAREDQEFAQDMQLNQLLRDEYNKKYHVDTSEPGIGGLTNVANAYTQLPDDVFGNTELADEDEVQFNDNVVGNMANMWRSIF